MKISKIFNLNKTQHELDFVDIDINGDTPLFLDPYFISISDFPFAHEAKLSLNSFFNCLLCALRENRMTDASELFSHLGESNEICLGYSQNKPKGKGMGPTDAAKIFRSLKDSPALISGLMEDIEDFRIFVENVDKDKTSDMTANIIKKQLIEYTQSQCDLWSIPLTPDVPSGYYWNRKTNVWEITYTDMLVINEQKILLVPKRIVSYVTAYTAQKYKQHFVLNYLQNEHLRLNSSLVQHRKDKHHSPFVTKLSIIKEEEKKHPMDKKWLVSFTEKHKDVFSDFRNKTAFQTFPVSNQSITDVSVNAVCDYLIKQIRTIPSGSNDATKYHRTIVGIIELLFYPNLCNPSIEKEIHEGRKRIDIVFDNCSESGFFFRACYTHSIPSRFIMVECKNYSCDISNPELDQISGRFSPKRGQLGIIACRSAEDIPTLLQRCKDTYIDSRGLIIPLLDEDFIKLLEFKAEKREGLIDRFLQERFHQIALG